VNQQGYIIEIIDKNTAKLKMKRHSACASCGKCITSSESKDIIVEVDNSIGAKVGDFVEVNMDSINVLKATAIVYLFPLAVFMIGTIISYYLFKNEVISAVVGLISMSITFLILKKNDKKFRDSKEYIPVVTRIIGKEITL
jgi:sigma-E factor negative regulatory protein RseC